MGSEMKRLFFAVWPDAHTASALQSFQNELKVSNSIDGIRWTVPNQWHLTLHFLGDVDDRQTADLVYRLRAENWRAHSTSTQVLNSLCLWPVAESPRIIAVGNPHCGAELDHLHRHLQRLIEAEGLWSDPRAYQPHVTLGRQKEPARALLAQPDVPTFRLEVKRFHLMESRTDSRGAVYEPLADFELA
jgi:2'-5' RNA ligase